MAWSFEHIMRGARSHHASDVHLVRGVAPVYRLHGEIRPIEGEALDPETLTTFVEELLNEQQQAALTENWQVCFSRYSEGLGRFRVSVYMHAGIPEMAIRLCESDVRDREDLGIPSIVDELTRKPSGLVLVTGPTGVGKTTTLSYMIDVINNERRAKIISIEDPIEYTHSNRKSIIVQQEVLTDVRSYSSALINVLRQDPDVVVIGEMRDLDTIETAIIAAETGHLVMATLHTPDAVQTIQRICSVFPSSQQNSITVQLSNSLQAIIAQKLLPRADGKGRILACEVCTATQAVRNHIREHEPHMIYSAMQTGRKYHMQTMDQSLLESYQRGEISYDTAVTNAREPEAMKAKSGSV